MTEAQKAVEAIRKKQPAVYALALLCSPLPRVTPEYLRALRMEYGIAVYREALQKGTSPECDPHPPDADTEAALWFHPILVRGQGPEGFAFQNEMGLALRLALRDSAMWVSVLEFIWESKYREMLPPELKWNLELNIADIRGDQDKVKQLVGMPLGLLKGTNENYNLRRSIAFWMQRDVCLQDPNGQPLALIADAAASNMTGAQGQWLSAVDVKGFGRIVPYDIAQLVGKTPVGISHKGNEIEFSDSLSGAAYTMEIADTNPRVIELETSRGPQIISFATGTIGKASATADKVTLRNLNGASAEIERPVLLPVAAAENSNMIFPREALPEARHTDANKLQEWLDGGGSILNLYGHRGRGKHILAQHLLANFEGRKFFGDASHPGGLTLQLIKLVDFLGASSLSDLSEAIRRQRTPTLIALVNLTAEDFENNDLATLARGLKSQSRVKLLVTSESGIVSGSDWPTQEVGPYGLEDVADLLGTQPSDGVTTAIYDASSGEPMIVDALRRLVEHERETKTSEPLALDIAALIARGKDYDERISIMAREIIAKYPDNYIDFLIDLQFEKNVKEILDEKYALIPKPSNDSAALSGLINWCNKKKDHRLRRTLLNALDGGEDLRSDKILGLMEELGLWNDSTVESTEWPYWSNMAKALTVVLNRNDDQTDKILSDLNARDFSRWRRSQVISISVPKSGVIRTNALAAEIHKKLWDLAVSEGADHQQAAWTLMKDVDTEVEVERALEYFPRVSAWAKQRLVLSLMQLKNEIKQHARQLEGLKEVENFLLRPNNRYLTALLVLWTQHEDHQHFKLDSVFTLPIDATDPVEAGRRLGLPEKHLFVADRSLIVPAVADLESLRRETAGLVQHYLDQKITPHELRVYGDLVALQIEVGRTPDNMGQPLSRYDTFEAFTLSALQTANHRGRQVIDVLRLCLDEGMLWGIAQRFKPSDEAKKTLDDDNGKTGSLLFDLLPPEDFWTVAFEFAADPHEWVVRDTIGGIARLWPKLKAPSIVDQQGVRRLAEPVCKWMLDNQQHGKDQTHDVRIEIAALRAVSNEFREAWDAERLKFKRDETHAEQIVTPTASA